MASLVKDLVESGVHFGHRATHWNPKMGPYIFGKRNKIHIIDVKATIRGLLLSCKYITQVVASGKDVLFVGTKRQAKSALENKIRETGMHWVTERWLGGTLTNFRTIRERLKRLEELESLEQSGEIDNYSKKMESQIRREKTKIHRNLEGIRNMTRLPGVLVVVDVKHELNAVREARKLGIPTICLIDTDSDPDFADIPIPCNDDAMRSIEVVIDQLCHAVMEGKGSRRMVGEGNDDSEGQSQRPKRSSRAMFPAGQQNPTSESDGPAQEQAPVPTDTAADQTPSQVSTPVAGVSPPVDQPTQT